MHDSSNKSKEPNNYKWTYWSWFPLNSEYYILINLISTFFKNTFFIYLRTKYIGSNLCYNKNIFLNWRILTMMAKKNKFFHWIIINIINNNSTESGFDIIPWIITKDIRCSLRWMIHTIWNRYKLHSILGCIVCIYILAYPKNPTTIPFVCHLVLFIFFSPFFMFCFSPFCLSIEKYQIKTTKYIELWK